MYTHKVVGDEPFNLSSQAEQCWYMADPINSNWNVVIKMARRDNFDVYSRFHDHEANFPQQLDEHLIARNEDVGWVRQGVEPIIVDILTNPIDDVQRNDNDDG
ncbi:hypothetical protein ACH5RR_029901 [Cinchona calisaya]|uniref:DUF4216 domain-containing protein n=1 Tax=Cinchona calisaya TaxID=153742 RepID=A0ABD2YT12_9GENT